MAFLRVIETCTSRSAPTNVIFCVRTSLPSLVLRRVTYVVALWLTSVDAPKPDSLAPVSQVFTCPVGPV